MIRDDQSDEPFGDRVDDVHADASLYAVGALEQDAAQAFEEHLEGCASCREEVASFDEVLAQLAAAAPVQPPLSLRDAVLARIQEEAASSSSSGPASNSAVAEAPIARRRVPAHRAVTEPRPWEPGSRGGSGAGSVAPLAQARERSQRRRLVRWPVLVAAAALAAVVGIGGWVVGAQQQEQQHQQLAQEQTREQDRRGDLLAAGDLTVEQIQVEGRSASLLASASQDEALLVSSDLPDPGEGREYQLWLMRGETPTPDAHFAGGEVSVWLDGAVDGADAVAMTVEPAGGSPAPTTDPLAVIQL